MASQEYLQLLRDPRWQRKRLEIFQRDGFSCQNCASKTKNLQVHHRRYVPGQKPWEYDGSFLVTLCDDCHLREGFELIRIDEWDVYFRVNHGILVEDENNGAWCWPENEPREPNARVSRTVLEDPGYGSIPSDPAVRRNIAKQAIEALLSNLRRKERS